MDFPFKYLFICFLLLLQFKLFTSQCLQNYLDPSKCLLCDYLHYDKYYKEHLKLSIQDNIFSICYPKIQLLITRNVFVLSYNTNEIHESGLVFDKFYNNISTAFQEESLYLIEYLRGNLTIILQRGVHYISEDIFKGEGNEFFRRSLMNIKIESESEENAAKVIMNTTLFHFFISNSFIMRKIVIEEISLHNNFNNQLLSFDSMYGMFNLEYIYDNPIIQEQPFLIIENCSFNRLSDGFLSFISLSPLSGIVQIIETNFVDIFFPYGFIINPLRDFDNLYLLLLKFINIGNYSKKLNQSLILINCQINNYGLQNKNSDSKFINFNDFEGNLSFINLNFTNILNMGSLIYMENSRVHSNINLKNLNFNNILESNIFHLNKIHSFSLFQSTIKNCSSSKKNIFSIQSSISLNFVNVSCYLILVKTLFDFASSNIFIFNLHLVDMSVEICFSFINSNATVNSLTFSQINFSQYFFLITSGFDMKIFGLSMSEIIGNQAIFQCFNQTNLILINSYFDQIQTYSIFSLIDISLNFIFKTMFSNNILSYFWHRPDCLKIFFSHSIIKDNRFSFAIFVNEFEPKVDLIIIKSIISKNNLTSSYSIRALEGNLLMDFVEFSNNFMIKSDIFEYFFDFEMNLKFLIKNSFFLDNGIITKKLYYLTKVNNCLFSNWIISSSFFQNIIVIITGKIELVSGIISAVPLDGILEISNSIFIFLQTNPFFEYKGFYLNNVIEGVFKNNTFLNLKCNEQTFFHSKGGFLLTASPRFNYIKNNYFAFFSDNLFLNCSCFSGGSLAIIGINTILMRNMIFINSTAIDNGGHLFLVSNINMELSNITLKYSEALNGGAIFSFNIYNFTILNLNMSYSKSELNGGFYCLRVSTIRILKSHFDFNSVKSKGGVLYAFDTSMSINGSFFFNSQASYSGGIGYFSGQSELNISFALIENGSSLTGGGFYLDNIKTGYFTSISMKNLFSDFNGACFFIDLVNFIEMNRIFLFESITKKNGVIFVKCQEDNSLIKMKKITIQKTIAEKGSFLYFISASKLIIESMNFIGNSTPALFFISFYRIKIFLKDICLLNIVSEDNLIYVSGIDLEILNGIVIKSSNSLSCFYFQDINSVISNIKFTNNFNLKYAFECKSSNLTINDIILNNKVNLNQTFSFLFAFISNIFIKNGLVSNLISSINPILSVQSGDIILENTYFMNNNRFQLIETLDTSISLENCIFFNNQNIKSNIQMNFIKNDQSYQLKAINTSFLISSSSGLNLYGSIFNLLLNSCKFINLNKDSSQKTTGINLANCYILNISHTNFHNFSKNALSIKNDLILSNLNLFNCSFIENEGILGSSIFIEATLIGFFSSCKFIGNKAISKFGVAPGFAFFTRNPLNSKINLSNSFFINNTADFVAPTLISQIPIESFNNSFVNNHDSFNFTTKLFSNKMQLKILNSSSKDNPLQITSGIPFDLYVEIDDFYNNTLIFDNKTTISLKSNANFQVSIENNLCQSKKGLFLMKNLLIKVHSNLSFTLNLKADFQEIQNEDKTQILPLQKLIKSINVYSRTCLTGEIIKEDLSCLLCQNGSFSLNDPMKTDLFLLKCYDCPLNADCFSGKIITPQAGFYRYSNTSLSMIACISEESCLGFKETQYNDLCDENCSKETMVHGACLKGNYGELCFYCESGYFKLRGSICASCERVPNSYYLQMIFILIGSVLFLLFNGISAENLSSSQGFFENFNALNKILINHFQQISIIFYAKSLPLDFIPSILNTFEYFSFPLDFMNNKCFLQSVYFDPTIEFLINAIVFLVYPFFVSIFCAFIRFLISLFCKIFFKKKNYKVLTFQETFVKFRLYFIISIFMYYPQIIKSYLSFFNCFKVDSDGKLSLLKVSPSIECWKDYHLQILFIIGIPGIILSALISQIYLFTVLKSYKKISSNTRRKMSTFSYNSKDHSKKNVEEIVLSKKDHDLNQTIPVEKKKKTNKNLTMTFEKLKISNLSISEEHNLEKTVSETCIYSNFDNLFKYYKKIQNNFNSNHSFTKNDEEQIERLCIVLSINQKKFKDNIHRLKAIKKQIEMIKDSRVFSFFYKDLKEQFYYWECSIFLRKFCLSIFINIPQILPEEINVFLLSLILIFVILITTFAKPYVFEKANNLEIYSIFVCLLSLVTSMILDSKVNRMFQSAMGIVFFSFNVHFVLLCVIYSFGDMKKKFKEKNLGKVYRNMFQKLIKTISKVENNAKILMKKK